MATKKGYELPKGIDNEKVEKYINQVVSFLKKQGSWQTVDTLIIDTLAWNYKMLLDCFDVIATQGITSLDRYGHVIPSPVLEVKKTAENQINKCIANLGLSAKSRKQISLTDSEQSELEKLLND